MDAKMSGILIFFRIISAILFTSYVSCELKQVFPGLTIDRVRKINPIGKDLASSNIEDEESKIVQLDEKHVRLFADYDKETGYFLVIGHSEADQSITFREGSFKISGLECGNRFILYLNDEQPRSSDGVGAQPSPFYVFDFKNEDDADLYLDFIASFADQQSPSSSRFYEPILEKLP